MAKWTHKGFEEFNRGRFDNGGDNLYVNADGVIETIHRFGVNNDGYASGDHLGPFRHCELENC